MTQEEIKTRLRFVDDYPIQIIQDDIFEEQLRTLNTQFHCYDKWVELRRYISTHFNGNYGMFIEHYAKIRDKMINDMKGSDAYIKFMALDMSDMLNAVRNANYPTTNVYTHEQNGCRFLSIDMSKANFQAMKYIDPQLVLNADTYDEYITKYTDCQFIKETKHTRQVVFGQANPKRQMQIEKYMIHRIISEVLCNIKWLNDFFDIFSVNSDEVIYKLKDNKSNLFETISDAELGGIIKSVYDALSINVKCNKFTIRERVFKSPSEKIFRFYQKIEKNDEVDSIMCCPCHYYTQVYKTINGMKITSNDLKFYFDDSIAQFVEPLKEITENV